MPHPQGTVFVIPLRPRKLVLPGVLLAGLLVLLCCRPNPSEARYAPVPAEPPAELRLIPSDAMVVLHIDVASLMNKEIARGMLALAAGSDERTQSRQFGATLARIDSLAFLSGEQWNVTIVTTRKNFERDTVRQLLAPSAIAQTHGGKKFYAGDGRGIRKDGFKDKFPDKGDFRDREKAIKDVSKEEGFQPEGREESNFNPYGQAVYFLSDRTYVFGAARGVVHFMDKAEKPGEKHPLQEVCSSAGKHQLTFGFQVTEEQSRQAEENMRRMIQFDSMTPMILYNFKPLVNTRRSLITVDMGEELRLNGSLTFPNARTADQALDAIRGCLWLMRGPLIMLEDQLHESGDAKAESALGKLLDQFGHALRETAIKADGSTVKVSVKAPLDEKLIKAAVAETLPGVQRAAHRATTMNNLKQIGLSIIKTADDADGRMPDAVVYSKAGKPLYSWRVAILPNLGERELYNKLKLDEPWDSEHNKPLLAKMPKVFEMPGVKAPEGMTFFQIFDGAGILSTPNRRVRYPASFQDGTSQTILVVEAAEAVHWAAPKDIEYSPRVSPLKQIGRHLGKSGLCVMGDGAIHSLYPKLSEETLRAAITPANNDILGSDWDDEIGDLRPRRNFDKEKFIEKEKVTDKIKRRD